MKYWKIVSADGVDLGQYPGATEEAALDVYAAEGGYASYKVLQEEIGGREPSISLVGDDTFTPLEADLVLSALCAATAEVFADAQSAKRVQGVRWGWQPSRVPMAYNDADGGRFWAAEPQEDGRVKLTAEFGPLELHGDMVSEVTPSAGRERTYTDQFGGRHGDGWARARLAAHLRDALSRYLGEGTDAGITWTPVRRELASHLLDLADAISVERQTSQDALDDGGRMAPGQLVRWHLAGCP